MNNSKFDYVVIDGFNRPNKNLIKCIDVPKDIKEIVFTSDGYRKPFNTLKETEEYLWYIKEVDPLCYKEFAYEKGFYKNKKAMMIGHILDLKFNLQLQASIYKAKILSLI